MVTVKNSTKKQRKTASQIRHRGDFVPINNNSSQGKTALTAEQHAFDFEQNQSRRWLHSQTNLPDSNGISKWQHRELHRYFTKPTLEERERPPLLMEGVKLSIKSQQHLARLTEERNNEKQKQGLPLNMTTRVQDWWTKVPIPADREGQNKRPRKENRKAKRIREFLERKNKETEQKAIAKEGEQVRRKISKMQIGDEPAEASATDEEGEDFDEDEEAMKGIDEQEENVAPHRWVDELTFRGPRP